MHALIFTRLTDGTNQAILLIGTYEHRDEAQVAMRTEWEKRINEMGWDPERSWFEDDQSFCGTESMRDTCRFYIFDTEHPIGFVNDLLDEV